MNLGLQQKLTAQPSPSRRVLGAILVLPPAGGPEPFLGSLDRECLLDSTLSRLISAIRDTCVCRPRFPSARSREQRGHSRSCRFYCPALCCHFRQLPLSILLAHMRNAAEVPLASRLGLPILRVGEP